jgi:hypothetical protein
MDKTEQITKKVLNNPKSSISISRLPKLTKDKFIKLAEDEFCDDYGMTLKFLYDNYEQNVLFQYTMREIDMIKHSISQTTEEKPQKATRNMLDGKSIRGGKEDE